ncbi:MAG: choice-of-anchor R domain-containing protein [Planctomycetota bacterium]
MNRTHITSVALLAYASLAQGQLIPFNDQSAWEAELAVRGVTPMTETFDGIESGDLNPGDPPFALSDFTITVEGRQGNAQDAFISGGRWNGELFPQTRHTAYVHTFDRPVFGFGQNFVGAASGLGIQIETTEGTVDILADGGYSGGEDGFFGFISDQPIREVRIVGSTGSGVGEIYDALDVVYAFSATILTNLTDARAFTLRGPLGLDTTSGDDNRGAVGFTTGARPLRITEIEVQVSKKRSQVANVFGGLHLSSGGNPGSQVASFSPVVVRSLDASLTSLQIEDPDFTLDANTSYWMVLDADDNPDSVFWSDVNVTPVGLNGVTFDGYRASANGGTSWVVLPEATYAVRINAVAAGPACVPDVTTTGATLAGQPGFGVPDGAVDLDDLGFFLSLWLGFEPDADVTTTGATLAGQPGFGQPDGVIDLDDLGFFISSWLEGCS